MIESSEAVIGAPYLPLRALSAYAGLSIRTLRTYLTHPAYPLPHYRIGGRVVIRRSEYDSWVARFRCAPTSTVDDIVADTLRGL